MISNSRIALLCGLAATFISMGILAHDPCQDPTVEAQNTPQNTQDISFPQSELEDLPALVESQLLLPIEPAADNRFGTGISLSGETLAISASNQFNDNQGYVDGRRSRLLLIRAGTGLRRGRGLRLRTQ